MTEVIEFLKARLDQDARDASTKRTTAAVETKRELLAVWEATQHEGDRPHPLVVRLPYLLAAEYSDHPDYREEWKA